MTTTTLRESLERAQATAMMTTPPFAHFNETASQTGGPYVHIGLAPRQAGFDIYDKEFGNVLTTPATRGERIVLEGRVYDGSGSLVRDVLIEIWQANADGKYAHPADHQDKPVDPAFRGWGRAGADFDTGVYRFDTVKPGFLHHLKFLQHRSFHFDGAVHDSLFDGTFAHRPIFGGAQMRHKHRTSA